MPYFVKPESVTRPATSLAIELGARRLGLRLARSCALAAALFGAVASSAQDYPNHVVSLVVPASAGGSTDALARTLADELGKRWGHAVIVENKPGAGGMLGAQAVATAKPDGYTLLFTHGAPILSVPYTTKVPYDVKKDFAFVSQIGAASLVLAVGKDVPANNMSEFVAWARKKLGKVNYGSYGLGSPGHAMSAYLSRSRKLDMTHVAYKGEAPLAQALVGREVHWGVATVGTLAPFITSGRVKALAILGTERLEALPGVPTMREAGFPDRELIPFATGFFLLAPAATPKPVLARIERDTREAVRQSTQLKARMQTYGAKAVGNSHEDFERDFDAAAPVMRRLIESSGASVN